MRLLIDTDAFCKFGAAGLLQDAASVLGVEWLDCCRLPALPYMLDGRRLGRWLGRELCEKLAPIAAAMKCVPAASSDWLNQLVGLPDVDPGEAQLFACAAGSDDLILTGDKRSLLALRNTSALVEALRGRIAMPHAVLLALCALRGDNRIRAAMMPALRLDTMAQVCFSQGNSSPRDGLKSYLYADTHDLHPVVLWSPEQGASS
jgi:hypothetical protein